MPLNPYLLATFTRDLKYGSDFDTIVKRHQALSIIYFNLSMAILLLSWKGINAYLFPDVGNETLLSIGALIILSLVFLKKGNKDIATMLLIAHLHWCNFAASSLHGMSLGTAFFVGIIPGLINGLTSSLKIQGMNLIICFFQIIGHILRIRERFRFTVSDEQAFDILQMQVISFISLIVISIHFFVQKGAENDLWRNAWSSYKKIEEITKETIQAVQAKDSFISSLSHEVRNPLNSMSGSIDYLIRVITDSSHLRVLRNAKLSGEILLNLLTNVLDAAKLKAEKMELSFSVTDPVELLEKLVSVYSEKCKDRGIRIQAVISRNLPSIIYVDSSRLLQIMMNLVSNAIKFTDQDGEICVCITWEEEDSSEASLPENILQPISKFMPRGQRNETTVIEEYSNDLPEALLIKSIQSNEDLSPQKRAVLRSFKEFSVNEVRSRLNNLRGLKPFQAKTMKDVVQEAMAYKDYFVWDLSQTSLKDVEKARKLHLTNYYLTQNYKDKKGYLKIQITDNGSGIAEDNIPRLFNQFAQAEHNIASVHGGTGLGLWICKQFCKKMGGDITLSSKVGHGSTFVFYIPVNNRSVSEANLTAHSLPREHVRALVVDDYPYNRDLHKLLLEREGVQVNLASDGQEALEKYINNGEGYYDFIMMDIQMPGMDGLTAVEKIREYEEERRHQPINIYFISGEYMSEEEVVESLKKKNSSRNVAGIRYIRKPISVDAVRKIVEKYINSHTGKKNKDLRDESFRNSELRLEEDRRLLSKKFI